MSRILIVCSGGMSSAIVMRTLKQEGEKKGMDIVAEAVGSGQAQDAILKGDWDLVLVAPQVRNRTRTFKGYTDSRGIPIRDIPPRAYGPLGGGELLGVVVEALG